MSFEKSYLWHFSDLNAAFIEHKLQADGFPYNFKLDWHFGHAFDDGLLEIIRMSIKFTSHSINLPGLLIFGSAIWTFRFCCCVSAILHCLRKFIFNHFCLQKKKFVINNYPTKHVLVGRSWWREDLFEWITLEATWTREQRIHFQKSFWSKFLRNLENTSNWETTANWRTFQWRIQVRNVS